MPIMHQRVTAFLILETPAAIGDNCPALAILLCFSKNLRSHHLNCRSRFASPLLALPLQDLVVPPLQLVPFHLRCSTKRQTKSVISVQAQQPLIGDAALFPLQCLLHPTSLLSTKSTGKDVTARSFSPFPLRSLSPVLIFSHLLLTQTDSVDEILLPMSTMHPLC